MPLDLLFGIGVLLTRLLQILAGVLLCVLGYRLFQQVPASDGGADVSLSQHLKFHISKVGPGVFFALFGAAILIQALANPLRLERELTPVSGALSGDAAPATSRVLIAGQRDATAIEPTGTESTAARHQQLQRQLRFLNGVAGWLRQDLSIEQRVAFEHDQREAKLALMTGAWSGDWGDAASFAMWVRGQQADAPDAEAKAMWETR